MIFAHLRSFGFHHSFFLCLEIMSFYTIKKVPIGIFKLYMQKKQQRKKGRKKEQRISHANEMQGLQFKDLQRFYLQTFSFA